LLLHRNSVLKLFSEVLLRRDSTGDASIGLGKAEARSWSEQRARPCLTAEHACPPLCSARSEGMKKVPHVPTTALNMLAARIDRSFL
jgi:hypothetical protein